MPKQLSIPPVPEWTRPGDDDRYEGPELDPNIERFAHWLDSQFSIPGTNIRFGLDVILGLFPALGDLLPSIASLYILFAAQRYGVSRATLARMATNIAFDYVAGSVPVAGDVFDVYWKSNDRNAALLAKHVQATPKEQRKIVREDRFFVAAIAVGLMSILGVSIAASWFGMYLFFRLIRGTL